jgi:hypothetical protein
MSERHLLSSTCVDSAEYDEETGTLTLTFVDTGAMYVYLGVEPDVFTGLIHAASVGAYYNAHIRGVYTSARVA